MPAHRRSDQRTSRTAILDIAEQLVQRRGFNGFSYADVAAQLGMTPPALHYHFRGKGDLGEALITRYAQRFEAALEDIDALDDPASAKLQNYADLYLGILRDQRMCLCGMLAAEYQTLPEPMRQAVTRFFDYNQSWLARLLETGRAESSLHYSGTAKAAAQLIVGALEGAMLVTRPYHDTSCFEAIAGRLLGEFANGPDPIGRAKERNHHARGRPTVAP